MGKTGKVVLTVLLLAGFGAALWFALRGQSAATAERDEAAAIASSPPLKGLIALDVEPFFADPCVKKILAANQIAEAARKAKIAVAQSLPFHTPMVIASWQPIAKPTASTRPSITDAMLARKRWKDLKGAEGYDVSRGVLGSTEIIRGQIAKSQGYVDRVRQQRAKDAGVAAIAGPVAL